MTRKISLYVLLLSLIMSLLPMNIVSADSTGVSSLIGISTDMNEPDKEITRGELAQMAISLTKSTIIEDGKAVFIDIPVKHKLFSIVNTVYLNGLMSGYSDSTFRPDSSATVDDAVRMFLNIVGYGSLLKNGSNAMSDSECVSLAKSAGIMKGVSQGTLTNAKMNKMIDNLSDVNILEINNVLGSYAKYEESSKTYLNTLGYSSVSGVVGAVGAASIYGYDTTLENFITVGENQYRYSGIDMLEYLGCDVKVILDEDEENVLGISLRKSANILEIDAKDLKSYNNYTYEYSVDINRTKTISFNSGTRIVYNGANMEYDKNLMLPNDGKIRFVDSNSDGKYDLLIIYSAVIYRVGSFVNEETLTDTLTNGKYNISGKDITCYRNGVSSETASITKDMFIRIMPDKMDYTTTNGTLIFTPSSSAQSVRIEIIASSSVEGDIATVGGDSIELSISGDSEVTSKEYTYSLHIQKLMDAKIKEAPLAGGSAVLYLDENEEIIDMEFSSKYTRDNGMRYGYLVSLSAHESGEGAIMVIVNESAQKEVFKFESDFVVNGKKTNIDKLKQEGAQAATNTVLFNSDGTAKRQLIGYTLGKNGIPNCIYCAKDYASEYITDANGDNTETKNPDYKPSGYMGYDKESFSLDYNTGKSTVAFRQGVGHLYSFNEATVGFVVPTNYTEYQKYKVYSDNGKNALTYDNMYALKFYNVGEDYTVGALLLDNSMAAQTSEKRDFSSPVYGGNAQATLITQKISVWDDDEAEVVTKVKGVAFGYAKNACLTSTVEVELDCDDFTLKDTDTVIHSGKKPFGNLTWDEVQVGDVILYRTDNEGKVNAFVIMNRASEMYDSSGNAKLWRGQSNLEATIAATLSEVVKVNSDGSILFTTGDRDDFTTLFKGSTKEILLFNKTTKQYEVITSADLQEGDIVFTRSWTGKLHEVVVYR